jgi:hypothetical protein
VLNVESASGLFFAGLAFGIVGLLLVAGGMLVLFRLQPLRCALYALLGVIAVSIGVLASSVAIGVQGYQALTRETVAATILVSPSGPQRFDARVRWPDGREASFVIAGDEVYVDAHVLKWKRIANLIGLHTAYELDRIAGRYRSVEQERSGIRTVYPLNAARPLDLFELRSRYVWLAPLVDAEYGSATFVPVGKPMELEVRVSTSGLLLRETSSN